jgi:hypothetical protein
MVARQQDAIIGSQFSHRSEERSGDESLCLSGVRIEERFLAVGMTAF